MTDFAAVLAELEERRTKLDTAIAAIRELAPLPNGKPVRKARKNGRPKAEETVDEGPGRGRKMCPNCHQSSGAAAKRCQHCMEAF